MAGANRSITAITECKAFLQNGGNRGLFARTSVANRSSWNMFRLYGLRRDEYLSAKKW